MTRASTHSWTIVTLALSACGSAPVGEIQPQRTAAATVCAQAVSSGDAHACALRGDGTVWCWGLNSHGQLGLGDQINHPTPTQIVSLDAVRAIATGASHSCALRDD